MVLPLIFIRGTAAIGQVSADSMFPANMGLIIHYMKEALTEKITEITGLGYTKA